MKKRNMRAAAGIIALLVVMPIWFYLLYQVLERVEASELMWFLFWIYVPAHLIMQLVGRLVTED